MICVILFCFILASCIGESEDVSVPKDIDLMALPQLCFPGIVLIYHIRTLAHICLKKEIFEFACMLIVAQKVSFVSVVYHACVLTSIYFVPVSRWAPSN